MSVVTIQLGQCGNQVGCSFFDLLQNDHPSVHTSAESAENREYREEMTDTFFTEMSRGRPQAKTVLVDMEPKVIRKAKLHAQKSGTWSYPCASEYIQQQGSGNNWALGYHENGEKACSAIIELCRAQVEKCDYFGGFLILMSLAGGTGSGMGARLTNNLRDLFPEAILANHVVWPFSSGEVILQNYNIVLTLSQLQKSADLILSQRNENAHQICTKLLGIPKFSFEAVNRVISHRLASILQPTHNTSKNVLNDLAQALAAHPTYKLVGVNTVPLVSERSMEYNTYHWPALLKRLRQMAITDSATDDEGLNWNISTRGSRYNKFLSSLLVLRGKDVYNTDTSIFKDPHLYSSKMPAAHRFTEWRQTRNYQRYEKSATLACNGQSFCRGLDAATDKAWCMFNAGAYVHQYERYGLDENEFIDSFAAVEQIVKDYQTL